MFLTQFDKVIILQRVLDGVVRVQQAQTLAPAHDEAQVLHRLDAAVVRLVLHVALEGLLSEPPDGVLGFAARHRQPLVTDVHGETRHRAVCGTVWPWRAAAHRFDKCERSAACSSAANQRRRSRAPPRLVDASGSRRPPNVTRRPGYLINRSGLKQKGNYYELKST